MSKISAGEKAKLDLATSVARTSRHRWRVGAVVERGGRILAFNTNLYRNDIKNVEKPNASVHAEVAALRQILQSTKRANLFVARVNKAGDAALAKPCDDCMEYLISCGIHKVFWTEDNDGFGWTRL